jgi:hypothetical protein
MCLSPRFWLTKYFTPLIREKKCIFVDCEIWIKICVCENRLSLYTRCRVECVKRIYKWKVAVKSVLCWAMTLFYLKSSAKMVTYSIWSLNITRCLYTYRPITDRRLRNDYFSCRFLNMIIYLYSRESFQ